MELVCHNLLLIVIFSRSQLVTEAQLFGVELSDAILSLLTRHHRHAGSSEPIVELVKRLFVAQKNLSLQYMPEISSTLLSLFVVLIQSDLEYEQLSLLKLLNFLLKWKSEKGMFPNSHFAGMN
jgi:hypothetical protein